MDLSANSLGCPIGRGFDIGWLDEKLERPVPVIVPIHRNAIGVGKVRSITKRGPIQ